MREESRKYLIYPRPVKGRGFVAPNFSPGTFKFMRAAGTLYLRYGEGVSSVSCPDPAPLAEAFHRFEQGSHRLIIAFRHSTRMDAPVLLYVLSKMLRREAARLGLSISRIPHVRFLYGKDVLNWAGKAAVWLFPRIGNIPVVSGEPNRTGLNLLREEVRSGLYPIALAPEGQVNYHMYQTSGIASGTASLARWGMESGKEVTILPVAIGYRYSDNPAEFVLKLAEQWGKRMGVPLIRAEAPSRSRSLPLEGNLSGRIVIPFELAEQRGLQLSSESAAALYSLLTEVMRQTLNTIAALYAIPPLPAPDERTGSYDQAFRTELLDLSSRICESALAAAESLAGLDSHGTWIDRIFRLRFTGAERLYPERFDPMNLPPFRRKIADVRSIEARLFLRHSQIVDVLEYFDPDYIVPPCKPDRFCEYALNLLDVVNRAEGGDISSRVSPKGLKAFVVPGDPLEASRYFTRDHSRTERSARRLLTDDLARRLQEVSERLP